MSRGRQRANRRKALIAKQTDSHLKKAGIDQKVWTQNQVRVPRYRVTTAMAGKSLMFAAAVTANGYRMNLYEYDVTTNSYDVLTTLLGQGSAFWGSTSNQWESNAILYELYRTDHIQVEYTPPSLMNMGSQSGCIQLLDPVGKLAGNIQNNLNLPADTLEEVVSDVKQFHIVPPLKQAKQVVNLKPLMVDETIQPFLQTIDSESATGERQLYQESDPIAAVNQRSYLPAGVIMCFFEIPQDLPDNQTVDVGILKFSARMTFSQRREYDVTTNQLMSKSAAAAVATKMFHCDLVPKQVTVEEPQASSDTPAVDSVLTMSSLQRMLGNTKK